MATKLIIIEGLPGSGKSTTAGMVYDILKNKGINAEIFYEGDYNHPTDFDGVAYLNNEEFNKLQQTHSISRNVLDKIKIKYYDGYLIPFRKAMEEQKIFFEDKLLKDIIKNDVYELPIEIHTNLILKRWEDFVNHYIYEDKVVIFECCFIQNPVTVSMVRSNSPKDVTMRYIHSLADKIKSLEPVLIYVEQKDIKASFNKVVCERPKEWFDGFKHYYINQGYGLENGLSTVSNNSIQDDSLSGIDEVIEVLKVRSSLEHEIYDSLELTKYIIDNSEFNIDLYKKNIKDIIEAHL